MNLDLDNLEQVAQDATPGPWVATKEFANRWGVSPSPEDYYPVASVYGQGDLAKIEANAAYIAAANPAVVLELVRRLRAAEAENANLRQAVADNITSSTMLTNMGIVNGGMNITLEGGACQLLADAFCEQFRGSGATNFVEMGFTGPDNLQLLVTLQKVYGKTPAQLKREAEERVAQLEAEAVRREEYIETLHAERIGGAAQGASHD